jgi:hypothetical protein
VCPKASPQIPPQKVDKPPSPPTEKTISETPKPQAKKVMSESLKPQA